MTGSDWAQTVGSVLRERWLSFPPIRRLRGRRRHSGGVGPGPYRSGREMGGGGGCYRGLRWMTDSGLKPGKSIIPGGGDYAN